MRIGMDARILPVRMGGVTTYIECLSREIAEMGHEVLMISNDPLPQYDSNPKALVYPRRVGPIRIRGLWESVLLPLQARAMRMDMLWFPAAPVAAKLKTCPRVITIHDLYAYVMPDLYEARQAARTRRGFKAAVASTEAIITVSEQTKSDIIRLLGVPEDKITVIPLAGRSGVYRIDDRAELEETRKELGLPERFVLCVGGKNSKRHKNTHRVVEAFAMLGDGPLGDVELVVVGVESDYIREAWKIGERAGVLDKMRLTGVVDDRTLRALYNLASAFAFPSLCEGFGLPILEAMTCGTPVITSDRGAMKEVAGDAAVLIDPDEPAEIADAIRMLLTDSACHSDHSSRGLARASSFTWAKTAEKTLEVFTRLCG
jgi:glycosyltransferase involved in cell wall biosynthesis